MSRYDRLVFFFVVTIATTFGPPLCIAGYVTQSLG